MEVKNGYKRKKYMDIVSIFTSRIRGLLGRLASSVSWLWWLSYEQEFGLQTPLVLDLNVLKLTFGLMFKINIASIIGMVLSIFIYKKI